MKMHFFDANVRICQIKTLNLSPLNRKIPFAMNRKTILGILALSAGLLHAENRSFDEAQSAWVVDAGTYKIMVGASSRDIRANATVDVEASTRKVNDVLKTVPFID